MACALGTETPVETCKQLKDADDLVYAALQWPGQMSWTGTGNSGSLASPWEHELVLLVKEVNGKKANVGIWR